MHKMITNHIRDLIDKRLKEVITSSILKKLSKGLSNPGPPGWKSPLRLRSYASWPTYKIEHTAKSINTPTKERVTISKQELYQAKEITFSSYLASKFQRIETKKKKTGETEIYAKHTRCIWKMHGCKDWHHESWHIFMH